MIVGCAIDVFLLFTSLYDLLCDDVFHFALAFVLGVIELMSLAFVLQVIDSSMQVSCCGVYVGQVFGGLGVLVSFLQ